MGREVDVEGSHGPGRDAPAYEETCVGSNDVCVTRARARDPLAGEPIVGERAFDAEKVVRRLGERRLDKEPRFTGSELDLERGTAAEDVLGDERPTEPELLVGGDGEAQAGAILRATLTAQSQAECPPSFS